jgi:hypothetical protein
LWAILGWTTRKCSLWWGKLEQEFAFRVSHLERIVEVYNDRLDRWETEKLQDLVESVPYQATFQVLFKHAGETRFDTVHFGWFMVRIPNTQKPLWILVADDETLNRQLVLITNIPLSNVAVVQQVYNDWRLRVASNMAIASIKSKVAGLPIWLERPARPFWRYLCLHFRTVASGRLSASAISRLLCPASTRSAMLTRSSSMVTCPLGLIVFNLPFLSLV